MKIFTVLVCLLAPVSAYAYGQLFRGQVYACSAPISKTKVRKEKICAESRWAATTQFVGKWDDWDGQKVTCRQTNVSCVYEE